jgi:hypothetical protein
MSECIYASTYRYVRVHTGATDGRVETLMITLYLSIHRLVVSASMKIDNTL